MFDKNKYDALMKKSVQSLDQNLSGKVAGRATPELVSSIAIIAYGDQKMKIQQLATIGVLDNFTLLVRPFDKSTMQSIDKGIQAANLGLSTSSDSDSIKIRVPRVTEETRQSLVKEITRMGEDFKVAIRNIRRDAVEDVKGIHKLKKMSDDEQKRLLDEIQKITDAHIKNIELSIKKKSDDILKM